MQPIDKLPWTGPDKDSSVCSFEGILAPVTIREFVDRFWSQSHLFVHRNAPDYFGDLFTIADVDRCMAAAAKSDSRYLTVVGAPGSGRESLETAVAHFPKDVLYQRFDAGDSLRLLAVEQFWAPVANLVASLGEALGAQAKVNAYLTPAHSQAFTAHFDYTDAFILQVAGNKEWFVYEPDHWLPLETDYGRQFRAVVDDDSQLVLRERSRLETGDLLYMPRGFYHKALTSDVCSLHLTVSINPVYWVDFMKRSLELLTADHVELRAALPPGFVHSPEARAQMAQTFAALLRLTGEGASFESTLESFVEKEMIARDFPPDGHFAALANLAALRLDSLVERRAGVLCRVEISETTAAIRFGPAKVDGPSAILPALEFVCERRRFLIRELPDTLTDQSKLVLARRLVRDGLLRPVDDVTL